MASWRYNNGYMPKIYAFSLRADSPAVRLCCARNILTRRNALVRHHDPHPCKRNNVFYTLQRLFERRAPCTRERGSFAADIVYSRPMTE